MGFGDRSRSGVKRGMARFGSDAAFRYSTVSDRTAGDAAGRRLATCQALNRSKTLSSAVSKWLVTMLPLNSGQTAASIITTRCQYNHTLPGAAYFQELDPGRRSFQTRGVHESTGSGGADRKSLPGDRRPESSVSPTDDEINLRVFRQGEQSTSAKARESVTFHADGSRLLRLFEKADRSTVLHEARISGWKR